MPLTLEELDAMGISEAQALPLEERDPLLDLIIADGRGQTTDQVSYRKGLYCDYFQEDLTRFLKVKAVKVLCRGTTPSGSDGVMMGDNDADQYRAAFRHVQTTLETAGTAFSRVVTLIVFLTNMDNGHCSTKFIGSLSPIHPAGPSLAPPAWLRSPWPSRSWNASRTGRHRNRG